MRVLSGFMRMTEQNRYSTSSPSPPGDTRASRSLTTFSIGAPQHLFLDPASVLSTVGTIVSVGKFLLGLFQTDETVKLLSEINAKIDTIHKELDDIVTKLDALPVYISNELMKGAENKLFGIISKLIVNSPRLHLVGRDTVDRWLDDLQDSCRTFMRYGYAGFSTVALACRFEGELLDLVGVDAGVKSKMKELARGQFLEYFDNAIAPTIPGSLTANRLASEKSMAELEKQFPPRDGGPEPVGHTFEGSTPHRDCVVAVMRTIRGNLDQGFTGRIDRTSYCTPVPGSGRPGPFSEVNNLSGPHFTSPNYDSDLHAYLGVLNAGAARYQKLMGFSKVLSEAESQVLALVPEIKRLMS